MTEHASARSYLISYFALALGVSGTPLISLWNNLDLEYKARSIAKEFRRSDLFRSLPSSLGPDSMWRVKHDHPNPKNIFVIWFKHKGVRVDCGSFDIVTAKNQVRTTCPHHLKTHDLDDWEYCIKNFIESLRTFDAVSNLMEIVCCQKFGKLERQHGTPDKWLTKIQDCPTNDSLSFEISYNSEVRLVELKWITRINYIKTRYWLTSDFCATEMDWSGPYYHQLGHSFEAKQDAACYPYQFARRNTNFKHRSTRDAWLKTMGKRLKESIPPTKFPRCRDSSPSRK